MHNPDASQEQTTKKQKPTLKQLIGSVLAAGIGVQSDKNRERDFKHGNIKTFIVAGLIFTVIFVFTVVLIVNMVLA